MPSNCADNPRQRGVILLLACFCLPVIIGMMGLGIDVGIMYAIKARIQMACDGAAVSALRSLSLAQTTGSQTTAATNTAAQWFKANFAGNYMGAINTSTPTITVTDDNTNHIRTVSVSATTTAPAYFMKLWGKNGTVVGATGAASRRDVSIMMVLDRSGSMNNVNNSYGGLTPCQVMVQAAKQFTGMFQQNRDNVGLITFGQTVQIASAPTTTFQTTLGYTNAAGSGTGALDQISCIGGTNTPTAISLGWNELYKMQLPGAFNVIVLFTDGTPTAGTFNFVVPAAVDPTGHATSAFLSTSTCQDSTNKSMKNGGSMLSNPRNWISSSGEGNSGNTISLGANTYYGPFSGVVGGLYGDFGFDAGVSHFFVPAGNNTAPYENQYTFQKSSTEAPGCAFVSNAPYGDPANDIAFVPPQDIFGNSTSGYRTSGMATGNIAGATRMKVDEDTIGTLVFNLADNAGNWARSTHTYSNGVSMPGILIYTIGLGGNGGVDFTLLQRIANDPNADPHGNYGAYANNTAQPVGTFIYSADSSTLQSSFMRLASMILRISK